MTRLRLTSRFALITFLLVAVLASLFIAKDVDFRVYWLGVTGFFNGTRPAYGPQSGLGFPMEYRYPPVTYVLLWPFRWVPLRVGGFIWMVAAWLNAGITVLLALRVRRLEFDVKAIVAVWAFLCAYLFLAVRYGNVQPFAIAWIFAALILSETRPVASGILLALAVTFKIWPVLFIPWLFRRGRRFAAIYFGVCLIALWALPLTIFGAHGYWSLLRNWYVAVGRVGTTYSEFYYFPGQSLRGLLLRWLTPVAPPLSYFPQINVLSLDAHTAVRIWMVAAAILYGSFVIWMLRSHRRTMWAWDGAAFVIYSMIEPYAVKSGLISLAPGAITAGCLFALRRKYPENSANAAIRWANRLFLSSCALSFLQAILQYKPWQRYLLSFGMDFWGECLVLIAFAIWIGRTPLPQMLETGELRQTADAGHHAARVFGLSPEREKLSALASGTQFAIENTL
ncbi:MAG TPA: glycosyltransferase family 87 protein [Bryobacteraceae bacterium]|nr:glycosyltransferase family 87 protein [Bryobacteraceae bacterium]